MGAQLPPAAEWARAGRAEKASGPGRTWAPPGAPARSASANGVAAARRSPEPPAAPLLSRGRPALPGGSHLGLGFGAGSRLLGVFVITCFSDPLHFVFKLVMTSCLTGFLVGDIWVHPVEQRF